MSDASKSGIRNSQQLRLLIQVATAFLSAWFSFGLLNQKRPVSSRNARPRKASLSEWGRNGPAPVKEQEHEQPRPDLAGRTMDLTLFTVMRAVDVIACLAWSRWYRHRKGHNRWTIAESYAPKLADAGLFAMSAAVVMWAWFYEPERLPRSYEKWIGEVAKVDTRLIEALRRVRRGIFIYGKDTGQAPLLESMCRDFGWPVEWGDPSKTIPIPCEMVHMGCGPSCEKHAVYRFARTFKFACATYIPLQLVLRLRKMTSWAVLRRSIAEGAQSSAFLASFVSLFYYAVCLARTRVGPKIFDQKTVTPLMWDSGLCVGAGCLMCGWSILAEKSRKRLELALFVAPRAAATVLPRLYDKKVCLYPLVSDQSTSYGLHINGQPLLQPRPWKPPCDILLVMGANAFFSFSINTGSALPLQLVPLFLSLVFAKDPAWSEEFSAVSLPAF